MAHGLNQRKRGRGRGRGALGRGGSSRVKERLLGARKDVEKKARIVSIKNQIRSVERLLRKEGLAPAVKAAQEARLEELKRAADAHSQSELERAMALRYRKVKFFERRKVERRIRRAERQLRMLGEGPVPDRQVAPSAAELNAQLAQLREDLEYVKFFPKGEKYISLFMGAEDEQVNAKRSDLRVKIKANLAAAAAAGFELEETGSEEDGLQDMSGDDFFMAGSSSDDADADDERNDDTSREAVAIPGQGGPAINSPLKGPAPNPGDLWAGKKHNFSGRRGAGSGRAMPRREPARPQDQKDQAAARALMPPPKLHRTSGGGAGPSSRRMPTDDSSAGRSADSSSANVVEDKPKRKRTRPKKK